jgi:hypothetical protein
MIKVGGGATKTTLHSKENSAFKNKTERKSNKDRYKETKRPINRNRT